MPSSLAAAVRLYNSAGIRFRVQDSFNYYQVALTGSQVILGKVRDGVYSEIAKVPRRTLRRIVLRAVDTCADLLEETIPSGLLDQLQLPAHFAVLHVAIPGPPGDQPEPLQGSMAAVSKVFKRLMGGAW